MAGAPISGSADDGPWNAPPDSPGSRSPADPEHDGAFDSPPEEHDDPGIAAGEHRIDASLQAMQRSRRPRPAA
jgi:hypothetical protein